MEEGKDRGTEGHRDRETRGPGKEMNTRIISKQDIVVRQLNNGDFEIGMPACAFCTLDRDRKLLGLDWGHYLHALMKLEVNRVRSLKNDTGYAYQRFEGLS